MKTFSFHGNDNPSRQPWFLDDYSDYKPESSRTVYHYAYPYDDNVKHGSIHIPTYKKYSPYSDSYYSSTKKIPKEDKAFKKAISDFYTITDKDSTKYKELILKSGLPYCQEIKSKELDDKIKDDPNSDDSTTIKREAMTCYKCKDPKNGSTYEQCSYSSEPQASTNIEKFEHGPLRFRRSNEEFDSSEEESAPAVSLTATKEGKLKEPYRFSEEYFLPQASHKFSTEQKSDLCERVVKDSMICMVCKDPKTSGKYEQCSYVAEPNEKAYAYTKSSSFGKPRKSVKSGKLKKRDHREPAPTHESLESSEYGVEKVSEEKPRQLKDATGNSECKQVRNILTTIPIVLFLVNNSTAILKFIFISRCRRIPRSVQSARIQKQVEIRKGAVTPTTQMTRSTSSPNLNPLDIQNLTSLIKVPVTRMMNLTKRFQSQVQRSQPGTLMMIPMITVVTKNPRKVPVTKAKNHHHLMDPMKAKRVRKAKKAKLTTMIQLLQTTSNQNLKKS